MTPTPRSTRAGMASVSQEALDGHTTVLRLQGSFDLANAEGLRQSLAGVAGDRRRRLILDLSGVAWLDSAAIAVLVFVARRAIARRGRMALVRPSDDLWEAFQLLGLESLFVVVERVEDALAHPEFGI